MTIDIIDLTHPDYSKLNKVQLAMVRASQAKKDKILEKAQKEKDEIFRMLLANGTARSTMLTAEQKAIDKQAESDVDVIREDLKYQLAYEGWQWEGDENGVYRYPENPNYNLTPSQRFLVVREYYMSITDDPNARFLAYQKDTLAQSYLGEFYVTLYDLLRSYCK